MRTSFSASKVVTTILISFCATTPAHPESGSMPATEIAHALKGKVCTSRVGATFVFQKDGHYSYDGLWTDHGHYRIQGGMVTILLDSGLEKNFAISRRNGTLFMEDTAVSCV